MLFHLFEGSFVQLFILSLIQSTIKHSFNAFNPITERSFQMFFFLLCNR